MKLQKSLVYFKTALKANNLLLERMRHDKSLSLDSESKAMLEDVLIESSQALEMTDISLSMLGNTMTVFSSVISNNLNSVVRLLTITTVLLAIPTLVAGFFGMNVPIPGEDSPGLFLRIIGSCLLVIGGLMWFFRRQNWI
jgi:magnesium transporter